MPHALRNVFLMVAALALLASQALSALHFVLVPHHLCAVHGALEDGGASAKGTPTQDEHEHAGVATEPSDQDEHDACSLATRQEHAVLLEYPGLAAVALVEADAAFPDTGVSLALKRGALLSQAPKTSPPARA